VAVYVVFAIGLTVIDDVVAPVLQVKAPKHPEAVRVVLWPTHINGLVVVITGTSAGDTVIFILAKPEQDADPHDAE
jgi:predicted secreted protein